MGISAVPSVWSFIFKYRLILHLQLLEKHNSITIITVDYQCNYGKSSLLHLLILLNTEGCIVSSILPRQRNVNENILLTRLELI